MVWHTTGVQCSPLQDGLVPQFVAHACSHPVQQAVILVAVSLSPSHILQRQHNAASNETDRRGKLVFNCSKGLSREVGVVILLGALRFQIPSEPELEPFAHGRGISLPLSTSEKRADRKDNS